MNESKYIQEVHNKAVAERHLRKMIVKWEELLYNPDPENYCERSPLYIINRITTLKKVQKGLIMKNKITDFELKLYTSLGL